MDFEPYDSSGTDDDLPPSHQNRIPRGQLAKNGRSGVTSSDPYARGYGETDIETEIHNIEKEAYVSVLRAFKAQADVLTWEKEDIITQLRKELRLSDEEHRELLRKADADDAIRRIREWRTAGGVQTGISSNKVGHDSLLSPAVSGLSASRKKQKVTQSAHQSFSGPSPPFHSQPHVSNPQSSKGAKRGPSSGTKGKKQKSGQILTGLNSTTKSAHHPSSGFAGRGHANRASPALLANEPGEASFDSLIGRKVQTRWPDDNNFYEAVITDFDKTLGLHALVYDKGSANETWEWVNLEEIPPDDIIWVGGDPGIPRGGKGGPEQGMNKLVGNEGTLGTENVRGLPKSQRRKDYAPAQNGATKKGSEIRILRTSHLIKEVQRVLNSSNPDPFEIEKAKKALKEQEEALIDALDKLADISDAESD